MGLDGKISKDEILIEEDKSRMEKEIEMLKKQRKQDKQDWKKIMKILYENKLMLSAKK